MTGNVGHGSVAVEDASLRAHRHAQAGYADGCAGLPYALEFDLWSNDDQLAYETGRLWASNLAAARLKPPRWLSGRPPPSAVQLAVSRAAQLTGNCTPGEAMPPNDDPVGLEPGSVPERSRRRQRR